MEHDWLQHQGDDGLGAQRVSIRKITKNICLHNRNGRGIFRTTKNKVFNGSKMEILYVCE